MTLLKQIKKLIFLFIVYWIPFLFVLSKSDLQEDVLQLPISDAVIIFGTLVRQNKVSDLLKERLDSGIAILKANKAKKIVVSNTASAALIMKKYLIKNGVKSSIIEVDPAAETTPDTCRYEKIKHPYNRRLIFVSQGYHLSRVHYQCGTLGLKASLFAAEHIRENRACLFSSVGVFTLRLKRYLREAGLVWLVLLGIYN